MAAVAEGEAEMISARTKAALAAVKARGKVLGGARPGAADRARAVAAKGTAALRAKADARAADLAPMIEAWRAGGITSQAGLARALDAAGVPTARGGRWSNVQEAALLARIEGRREAAT